MNFFTRDDVSVVIDLAHNEAGLEALLEIMNGVRRPGARLLLGLGAVGDRQDDLVESLGEMGARDADVAVIAHKARLPARAAPPTSSTSCSGAAPPGSASRTCRRTPPRSPGSQALVDQAKPGDVVGLMCHEDRQGVYDWLAAAGFTGDTPETLRDKVRAARALRRGAGC